MIGIFDKTKVNDLNFALDTLSVKNNGISRNIANQDTPKYKAVKLVFSEVMEEYYSNSNNPVSLKRTNPMHMPVGDEELDPRTLVRFQNNPSIRNDGNDVNLDYEMSQQAEAELRYKLLSQIAGKKVTGLVDLTKTQAQ
ncbi:MAG: flagellar basal body rod protein FlgB [Mucispirillum sp.]|nr:flagellar basal body rod protein FlgB [Mucispirillum sp.]